MKNKKILVVYTVALLNLLLFGSVTKSFAAKETSKQLQDTDVTDVPIVDPINPSQEVFPTDKENDPIHFKLIKKKKPKPKISKQIKRKPLRIQKQRDTNKQVPIEEVLINKNARKLFLTDDFFKKQVILNHEKDLTGGDDDLYKDTYLGQLAKGLSGVILYGPRYYN